MAEENNEPNDTQSKPQSTESVKHVHLERKRPKLSKFDEQSEKGSKEKNAEQARSIIPKTPIAGKRVASTITRASAIRRPSFVSFPWAALMPSART